MVISWSSVYKIGKIVENFQFGVLETELSVPDDGPAGRSLEYE